MNEHKVNPEAVAAAAGKAPVPLFMRRDQATINGLVERANQAERGGPPLTTGEKLALEQAMEEGIIQHTKEETANELILRGLREADDRRVESATALVDELEKIALEVRQVRNGADWFDIKKKLAAQRKSVEMRAQFDKLVEQIHHDYTNHLADPRHSEFKQIMEQHIGTLKSVFDSPFRGPDK